MPKCRVEILRSAWQDLDKISDLYIRMAGKASAQRMISEILETIRKLGDFPYMGAQHPDPELARLEYRKVICRDYVCVHKIVEKTVYVYRVVNGKTDYPKLLK
jgi:plasmid stabilization system protein ParE